MTSSPVFISYSRVDEKAARQLFDDLQKCGVPVWIDKENIAGGVNWRLTVEQAIRNHCRYFLALLSQASVEKSRGYVNREIRLALEVLDEYPPDQIFIVPVRLEPCNPSHPRLNDLQWIDMFTDWEEGLRRILIVVNSSGNLELAAPQRVRWASPSLGGSTGLDVVSHPGTLVSWEELKTEIEERLLPQVREIPFGSRVSLGEFRGRKNWIIRVHDLSGCEVANVWYGTDPGNHWSYDGLVRVGPAKESEGPPVWQTFQRYSNGTYRRIRVGSE